MKYSLVNFCELDKFAVKSYCAIHGTDETLNLGDITKVDETELDAFNMICGGSPCQDFSLAGKQGGSVWKCKHCGEAYNPLEVHYSKRDRCPKCGSKELDKTRSSLLVEWLRMVRGQKPVWGIYENVKNIVGKKFRDTTFRLFEEELQEYGYNTYWSVLNAKNYGIPQNRERVYLILIRKEEDNGQFCFPKPLEAFRCLKDVLEDTVDEKYYLPQDKVKRLIEDMEGRKALLFEPDGDTLKRWRTNHLKKAGQINEEGKYEQSGRVYFPEGCCPTLTTNSGGNNQPKIVQVGRISYGYGSTGVIHSPLGIGGTNLAGHEQIKIVEKRAGAIRGRYDENGKVVQTLELGEAGACHTLTTVQKDNIILVRQKTAKGYEECREDGVANLGYPSTEKRGRVQGHGEICPTLTTSSGVCRLESLIRIRRLTPLECFRLMGFTDGDFWKAKQVGISDSQLYKQAGNSIVVDVLYYIFLELYRAMPRLFEDIRLSSFFSGIGAFEAALKRMETDVNR